MSGFDADHVYTVSVHDAPAATSPESPSETEKLLLDFLLQYRVGGEFIYRRVSFIEMSDDDRLSGLQRHIARKFVIEAEPARS